MWRKLFYGLLVGLASGAVAVVLWLTGVLDGPEFITWRWRIKAFAKPGPDTDRIKVILIDQPSLDWGKNVMALSWPWPRQVYAAVLDFCRRGGARAVAFDMLYTEPSAAGVEDDQLMGAAFARTKASVGALFLGTTSGQATNWPADLPSIPAVFQGLESWLATTHGEPVLPRAAFPIPEVATNVALLSNVSDMPDKDGIFRRA